MGSCAGAPKLGWGPQVSGFGVWCAWGQWLWWHQLEVATSPFPRGWGGTGQSVWGHPWPRGWGHEQLSHYL